MKVASDNKIEVLKSYCESKTGNLASLVEISNDNKFRLEHLNKRNLSEHKFFYEFCKNNIDESSPVFIEKGEINLESNTEEIIDLKPDLIISYGCSIIKSRLLEVFDNRFINVHLGLSPYYRGSEQIIGHLSIKSLNLLVQHLCTLIVVLIQKNHSSNSCRY